MMRRIVFVAAACAVTAGAAWMTGCNLQRIDAANELTIRYLKERSAGEARLREAEARIAAAEARRAEAISAAMRKSAAGPATVPQGESTASSSPDKPRRTRAPEEDGTARLLETTRGNPAVQNAELESHRLDLTWGNEPLFRRLGLSAEAKERFLDNLVRRIAEHENLLTAARKLGVAFHDPVVERLNAESEASYLAAQRELLGEAGVREMQARDRSGHSYEIAYGFAGMATLANDPLTPRQVQQLVGIIDAATSEPHWRVLPRMVQVDWPTVDAQADMILNPTQARLFKTAEAPGMGRAGTRFVLRLNQVIGAANRADTGKGAKESEK
jgi:hypothetical protein